MVSGGRVGGAARRRKRVARELHECGERGLVVFTALDQHYLRDGHTPFARLLVTGDTRIERLREIIAAKIPLLYKPVSPQQLRSAMMSVWAITRDDD